MSFRAKELLERDELTPVQLDSPIRLPGNGEHQKKKLVINSQSMTDHPTLIGTMLNSK